MPEPQQNEHPTPKSVTLGMWAVAGASIGYPVHLCFLEFPERLIARLFRLLISWVGSKQVLVVNSLRDLSQLTSDQARIRLILVYDQKLFHQVTWRLETTLAGEAACRPPIAVFYCAVRKIEESPGPTLTIHGSTTEEFELASWLANSPELPKHRDILQKASVRFSPGNRALWASANDAVASMNIEILKGFLLGAASLSQTRGPSSFVNEAIFRDVVRVLKDSRTQTLDIPFNPICSFMINRINCYLMMKKDAVKLNDGVNCLEDELNPPLEAVSRREVVDLGNPRSSAATNMVSHLMRAGDGGLSKFHGMGLSTKGRLDRWPAASAAENAGYLIPWTEKQVRTHFHRLAINNLITATRIAENQAWQYRLPESLSRYYSPFEPLPESGALEYPLAELTWLAPACPSPDHSDGQPEIST